MPVVQQRAITDTGWHKCGNCVRSLRKFMSLHQREATKSRAPFWTVIKCRIKLIAFFVCTLTMIKLSTLFSRVLSHADRYTKRLNEN